jgi:hypothetical protein
VMDKIQKLEGVGGTAAHRPSIRLFFGRLAAQRTYSTSPRCHLQRLLAKYDYYYHEDRTHLALSKETPNGRVRLADHGRVISHARLEDLHHCHDQVAQPKIRAELCLLGRAVLRWGSRAIRTRKKTTNVSLALTDFLPVSRKGKLCYFRRS